MAKTKSSTHGKQQKKIVTVSGYKKAGGVKVKPHRRSTPNGILFPAPGLIKPRCFFIGIKKRTF